MKNIQIYICKPRMQNVILKNIQQANRTKHLKFLRVSALHPYYGYRYYYGEINRITGMVEGVIYINTVVFLSSCTDVLFRCCLFKRNSFHVVGFFSLFCYIFGIHCNVLLCVIKVMFGNGIEPTKYTKYTTSKCS